MREFSYYELLGVTEGASSDEIGMAYRSVVLHLHPDKFADKRAKAHAERWTIMINEAYATLRDAARRSAYDSWRRTVRNGAAGSGRAEADRTSAERPTADRPKPPPHRTQTASPQARIGEPYFAFDVRLPDGTYGMMIAVPLTLTELLGTRLFCGSYFCFERTEQYLKDMDGVAADTDGFVLAGHEFIGRQRDFTMRIAVSYAQLHLSPGLHRLCANIKLWRYVGTWKPLGGRISAPFSLAQR